jgi:hypothetical protein
MKDRGYRDSPLLISEYGILFYDGLVESKTAQDNIQFMQGSFDWMLEARDAEIGYPADDNRLVQRWAWFSLDHDDWEMGGALFDYETYQPFNIGSAYAEYTGDLSPAVDLVAVDARQIGPVPYSPTHPVSVTLEVQVSNAGNVALEEPTTVRFLDAEGLPIAADQVISPPLDGCADVVTLEFLYPDLGPGAHPVRIMVDPENAISETDEFNNELVYTVLVATDQVFLPVIHRTMP